MRQIRIKEFKVSRMPALLCAVALALIVTACGGDSKIAVSADVSESAPEIISPADVPEYAGIPYVEINGNEPGFSEKELSEESFEEYGELDDLGRCGMVCASVGEDLMPDEKRGKIGQVRPTGWHTVKYDNVDGKYLYNRCHLIGYQLSGKMQMRRTLLQEPGI